MTDCECFSVPRDVVKLSWCYLKASPLPKAPCCPADLWFAHWQICWDLKDLQDWNQFIIQKHQSISPNSHNFRIEDFSLFRVTGIQVWNCFGTLADHFGTIMVSGARMHSGGHPEFKRSSWYIRVQFPIWCWSHWPHTEARMNITDRQWLLTTSIQY